MGKKRPTRNPYGANQYVSRAGEQSPKRMISVIVEQEIYERLKDLAESNQTSVSVLVRQTLKEVLL